MSIGWPVRCCFCIAHTTTNSQTQNGNVGGSWSKATNFRVDPARAAALREATERDRRRISEPRAWFRWTAASAGVYRSASRSSAPATRPVQWKLEAPALRVFHRGARRRQRSARTRTCRRLADSIKHAVAKAVWRKSRPPPPPVDR